MNKAVRATLLSTAAALAACASDTPTTPHTLYTNGVFLTQDTNQPAANSMIVAGEEIIAVGTDLTLENGETVDLGGAAVLPGIIDSHVHVRELGMDEIKADLVGVETAEEIAARLTAFAPNPKAGEWIIGQGWDEGAFGSRGYPDRAVIDAAFPNNPVALESLHGFAGFYNGKALEIAGITDATPNPEVGQILRRENGSATGVMLTLAQGLVNQHIPKPDQAQLEKAITAGLNKMAQAGVTSVHEAGMAAADVTAFQSLAAKGELPIRVYGMLNGNDDDLMDAWFTRGILDDPKDWLDIRSIKVFYDGSLGSRTAVMQAPYSDKPDEANPTERITPNAMLMLGKPAAAKGFQMAVHAIGDEGNNRTLNTYDTALENHPETDHRWRIEHAQIVLPDFYSRMADKGIIASMQSSHAVGDSGWAEDRVGPARIQHGYAWQRILAAGGRLIINSDLPGEPWEPMQTLYFAVTRKRLDGTSGDDGTPEDGWYADQALSVTEALHAMTLENAYAAFQEDKLGSLTAGKWADFIVLSDNPLTTAPERLKDIKITSVYVAGRKIK
ncbi:MAG: amidohydrolase [Maricaulaceae bacterium]